MTTRSAGSPMTHRKTAATRTKGGTGSVLLPSEYDHLVLIGRLQPTTRAHTDIIKQGIALGARKFTVLVGSAGSPRNPRNMLRFAERKIILERALETHDSLNVRAAFKDGAITILPQYDRTYDNTGWAASVQENIRTSLLMSSDSQKTKTAIIGYHKDPSTSYYLKMFGPLYGQINAKPFETSGEILDATMIRNLMLEARDPTAILTKLACVDQWLQESVRADLVSFVNNKSEYLIGMSAWDYIKAEYDAVKKIKEKWVPYGRKIDRSKALEMAKAISTLGPEYVEEFERMLNWNQPFPLTFNAADAIMIQSGHVLMTERNIWPGKGLLAFPGGHLEPGETLFQCALRELSEEVKVELPINTIASSYKGMELFDDPHRSLRGHYVSLGFLFVLNPRQELPRVGGDGKEARRADWMQMNEVLEENCFEDHHHGLRKISAQIKDYTP